MENWLERFYTQTDPVKRQQLLSENEGETEREEARLRKQLWEARYGKGKPRKDAYVGYLMNLKYIAESGGMDWGGRKKKLAMEAVHGLKLFQFEQKRSRSLSIRSLKIPAEPILRSAPGDVALPPFFSEWDSCLRKVLPERSQSN